MELPCGTMPFSVLVISLSSKTTRSETSKSIIEQRLARTEPGGAQHAAIGIAKERTSKLLPAYGCISNVQR